MCRCVLHCSERGLFFGAYPPSIVYLFLRHGPVIFRGAAGRRSTARVGLGSSGSGIGLCLSCSMTSMGSNLGLCGTCLKISFRLIPLYPHREKCAEPRSFPPLLKYGTVQR